MRILYLAHRVPYPPNKGEKIRMYHHLRYLASAHDVHLLSFVDQREDAQWQTLLESSCRRVEFLPAVRWRALGRGAGAWLCGRSFTEGYFGDPRMWRAVRRVVSNGAFDVVWASSSGMAPYLSAARAQQRIADFVDVDSDKWRQLAAEASAPLRWAYALESRRVRRLEHASSRAADRILFVSDAEAALFRKVGPAGACPQVVPNGVDQEFFRPPDVPPQSTPATILFTGTLDYQPNVAAVRWFASKVMPLVRRLVPDARFVAVGHRPSCRLQRQLRALGDGVALAGSVADIRPYFAQARVYVAPLRIGRGVQNKILEAMASGVPVVACPLALDGLEVRAGVHASIATTAEQFAAAVVELLRDPERCRQLQAGALELVERVYRWDLNLRQLDACLERPGAVIAAGLDEAGR